jgi:transposase-like protein
MRQIRSTLEIRERRIFSEAVKKQVVKDLLARRSTVKQMARAHQTSITSVYNWLYKYSGLHEQKCTLVVQMDSEAKKNNDLQARIAGLERIVGQKQLEIDFLNKLLELGSNELGFDLKKSFSTSPSNGTEFTKDGTGSK